MGLRDQRTMCGSKRHFTVDDVVAYWHGFSRRPAWQWWNGRTGDAMFDPELVDRTKDEPLEAYANHGRWMADCPVCGSGVAAWTENPRGCCLECGTVWTVTFPADHRDAEEVLVLRPLENRNWRPRAGEPIGFLALENAEHGYEVPVKQRDVAEQLGLATILEARAEREAA